MDLEVFSEAWVERCAEAIRNSPTYRESAASWEVRPGVRDEAETAG